MATISSLSDFNEAASRWLREHRPDRYDPNLPEWIDAGVDEVAHLLPKEEVRQWVARELLGRLESKATRRANKIIRDYADTGQLQLHWWDTANEPLAIEERITDADGKEKCIRERVALRALRPADLRRFAEVEERQADVDHKARLRTCDGARLMADRMESMGAVNWQQWAERECPPA